MSNEEYPNNPEDRQAILMALDASEPSAKNDCPSDLTLAAFIDNRLSEEEHEAVLNHLDACPDCYEKWLLVAETKADTSKKVRQLWKSPLLGVAVALAASLVIFINIYNRKPDLEQMLSDTFQTVSRQKPMAAADSQMLPWEQPSPVFGFTSPQRTSDVNRAFGAGLWRGKQVLNPQASETPPPAFLTPSWNGQAALKAEKWTDTSAAVFYHLGRQCWLLRVVCLSKNPVSSDFWRKQISIIEMLRRDLDAISEETLVDKPWVSDKLVKIQSGLEMIAKNPQPQRRYRELGDDLDALIDFLSPKNISKLNIGCFRE